MSLCPTVKALMALEIETLWAEDADREVKELWVKAYGRLRSIYHGPLYGHPEEIENA